jgi:Kef-type K+ transport system membrane component KefB
MTKITHYGLWLDFSSMSKEDRRTCIISSIFAFIAGVIAGYVTTSNAYGDPIPATEMTIAGLICFMISVFFWTKFYRAQDEMYQRFHDFSMTTGAYCFVVFGIIFYSLSLAGYIEEVVHQDVCFPLNFLFFVIGTGIGQVYFYRKHLN